jgi:hypothetical protein
MSDEERYDPPGPHDDDHDRSTGPIYPREPTYPAAEPSAPAYAPAESDDADKALLGTDSIPDYPTGDDDQTGGNRN